MKSFITLCLLLFFSTISLFAQPWYVRGTFNGWAGTAHQLVDDGINGDLVAGDGIFSRLISINTPGRHEFKVTVDDWSVNHPASNSWLYTTSPNQSLLFTFDSNSYSDGWLPSTNIVNVTDQLPPTANIVAVGDHNGWNNAGPEVMYDDGTNGDPLANDNIYAYYLVVAAPGTYNWKPTRTGTWDAWGSDNRQVNSANITYSTTSPNQNVFFYVDLNTGRTYTSHTPLPVELIAFNAVVSGSTVLLKWSTASETNNLGFGVERSSDGDNFIELTFIYGAGTSTEIREYSYKDINLASGIYYYRLKQIDFDGTSTYSSTIQVEINTAPESFSLEQNFPNPFNPSTRIRFYSDSEEFAVLSVYNALGQMVQILFSGNIEPGKIYEVEFDPHDLSSGLYLYRLTQGSNTQVRKMTLLK